MAQVSNQTVVDLFKKVYGNLNNLLPKDYPLAREIPFQEGLKVGDSFIEAFVLTNETGWTLAGDGQDAFDINPAVAGVVKQSTIKPSQTLLSSVIPFAFITRSAGGGEKSFFDGTKHVMQNHINSHSRLLEMMRLYGQSAAGLGYVSYAASGTIYRGVAYTAAGSIALVDAGNTTYTFTTGIDIPNKAIMLAPGEFAAGLWVGLEGVEILQVVSATGVIAASGKLVGVDSDLGIIKVDFVPVVSSSLTSHKLCFRGMEVSKEMVGMQKILANTGSLFGIDASSYALWNSNKVNLGGKRFSLKALQVGVSQSVNKGGLDKPLMVLSNPRTYGVLLDDEAAMRKYDSSYGSKATNGFETIEFYAANGMNQIMPHRMVKEGHVFGIVKEDWVRSGSAEISFKIPGIDREVIFPLENQAGFMFRSFADQYLLCRKPANQLYFFGNNDESVKY